MTLEAAKVWLDLASVLLAIGAWIFAWAATRHKAHRDHINALRERVTQLESELKHRPGQDEIARLHEKINPLHADLHGLKVACDALLRTMGELQRSVSLMNEYLLREKQG